MSVVLPKTILSTQDMTKREKLATMKARQSALALAAKELCEAKGYVFGRSLKIPGTYAFEAALNGREIRVGFKTAANRWMAIPPGGVGGWGLLSAVDQIIVVTFDNWNEPRALQVYVFEPSVLIGIGEAVYAMAESEGQTGMQWIPFDQNDASRTAVARAVGSLDGKGKLLVEVKITWSAIPEKAIPEIEVDDADTVQEPAPPLKLTIAQARAGLSAGLGVPSEAIKIIIDA